MAPVRIEEGDIVRLKDGQDGIIVQCVPTVFGYREFVIMLFDIGKTVTKTRLEFDKINRLDGDVDMFPMDAGNVVPATEVELPTLIAPNVPKCFATVEKEDDIDKLASRRLSLSTKRQTDWAV